ncbi:MAG TPA: response regulator [Pyrinomonadaceae bacterium]|jgi:CheY-like chemotaxis protein
MKRRVIVLVEDLFFAAKIRTTAEHLGIEAVFPRSPEALREASEGNAPALFIVDLHLQRDDPFLIARGLKADAELSATPLVGFFSHVQVELQRRAEASGFDRVLPRSAFTKRLPEILQGRI